MALADSLDDLIQTQAITPQLAVMVLKQFDKTVAEVFTERVKSRASVKGHLSTYRLYEDVWNFLLTDATFKMEGNEYVSSPKVKIIACKNSDPSPDAGK